MKRYKYQVYVNLDHPDRSFEGTSNKITVEIQRSSGATIYTHITSGPDNPGFSTGFSQFVFDCGAGEIANRVRISTDGNNGMYIDYIRLTKFYEQGGSAVVDQWGTNGGCGACLSQGNDWIGGDSCKRYGSQCWSSLTFVVGTFYFN